MKKHFSPSFHRGQSVLLHGKREVSKSPLVFIISNSEFFSMHHRDSDFMISRSAHIDITRWHMWGESIREKETELDDDATALLWKKMGARVKEPC